MLHVQGEGGSPWVGTGYVGLRNNLVDFHDIIVDSSFLLHLSGCRQPCTRQRGSATRTFARF